MPTSKGNMHQIERLISGALGGVLLLRSLARRSPTSAVVGGALLYRGVSGHSYLYQVLDVNTANGGPQREGKEADSVTKVTRSITIGKPASELYAFWRDPQHLSEIMGDFAEVTMASEQRIHWVMHAPLNQRVEWDTRIVEDRRDGLLRWQTMEGALLAHEGSVEFHPAPRDWGTEVRLAFRFDPPGGVLGNRIMQRLNIVPRMMVEKALRRFKSLIETGEAPTLRHNPSARATAQV